MKFARLPLVALLAALLSSACSKGPAPAEDKSGTAPKSDELPPLEVREDSPNLLLTWVDDKGDFHVVQKPADVPKEARGTVRIVVTNREEGTGKLVYVANLDETTANGSYRLKTMTRSAWEEIGASKRQARLEALAPSAVPSAPPGPEGGSKSGEEKKAELGGLVVIIYGAEWCKPCHDAERYLRQRGVNVVKKDIESNEMAAAEMQRKLARAGRAGASIPVIDVMGQIQVGFSPAALDQAIQNARTAKAL